MLLLLKICLGISQFFVYGSCNIPNDFTFVLGQWQRLWFPRIYRCSWHQQR